VRLYQRGEQPARNPDEEFALTHGELSQAIAEYIEKHKGSRVSEDTYVSISVEQYSTSVRVWHKETT